GTSRRDPKYGSKKRAPGAEAPGARPSHAPKRMPTSASDALQHHASVRRPTLEGGVRIDRPRGATPHGVEAARIHALRCEVLRHGPCTVLREPHVVDLGARVVGVTHDTDPDVLNLAEGLGHAVERRARLRAQLGAVEPEADAFEHQLRLGFHDFAAAAVHRDAGGRVRATIVLVVHAVAVRIDTAPAVVHGDAGGRVRAVVVLVVHAVAVRIDAAPAAVDGHAEWRVGAGVILVV